MDNLPHTPPPDIASLPEDEIRRRIHDVVGEGWTHHVWSDGSMTLQPSKAWVSFEEVDVLVKCFRPVHTEISAGPNLDHPGCSEIWIELSWAR